jgi:quinol monooxygenase YgiN
MMKLIYGGVVVDPAKVEAVTAAAIPFVAASNAEDNCVTYILSWDVTQPNRINLLEAWTDADAHFAHTQQQHTLDWTTLISAAAIEAPKFYINEAAVVA